ncbi:MAG: ATP-binding protein [Chloroflexi bacterium]|nr:ATP-binding protein [Chloroflexota bacterium]
MTDAKRSGRLDAARSRDADRLEASLGRLPKVRRRPALIILIGLPGSGKSHFARQLAKRHPAAILDSDALRGVLYKSPQHTDQENARLFPAIQLLTRRLLDRRVAVLLDATNLKEAHRKPSYRLAKEAGARLVIVRLRAPFAVMRERLARRDAARNPLDRSTADLRVLERMRRDYQRPRRPYFVVDTSEDVRHDLDKIVALLQS